jgi:hypothetical protein
MGAIEDDEPYPKGDLSRLRQSLGPEPEIVRIPQPTRRLGWFASGFMIASGLGFVIGGSVIFAFRSALANELMLLGEKYATGIIVTQVVPALEGHSSLMLDYKSALAKYFPGESPDYVSLEGYVDATVLIAALQKTALTSTAKN